MSILSLPSTTDDLILDRLSAAELFKYARTCKTNYKVVQDYIPRGFQLHKLLAPYFSPEQIMEFRRLQASTGMLISGSTALQFFDRVVYLESDLDLYVNHSSREEIGRWLTSIGYSFVPQRLNFVSHMGQDETLILATFDDAIAHLEPEPSTWDPWLGHEFLTQGGNKYIGAGCLFTFVKGIAPNERKIELITSMKSPLERILNFHSTCVMNIITHDRAYSFYPCATFSERRSLVCARPQLDFLAHSKYFVRGWAVNWSASREEIDDPRSSFKRGIRHVGDAHCWVLPVFPSLKVDSDHTLLVSSHEQNYVIDANSWDIQYNMALRPKMDYYFVTSDRLSSPYLVDNHSLHLRLHIAEVLGHQLEDGNTPREPHSETDAELRHEFLDRKLASFLQWFHSSGHSASETCPFSLAMRRRQISVQTSVSISESSEQTISRNFSRLTLD
ncbi:hypothetical protein BDN70DRAFT_884268 [Pholiota conissans]|uniref:F-box domain-containing protein n=1 Tax=Pholiota conissans TaxID=109636 RepID=A0A9P5YTT2_9AGAR|nr:hypothetical protein BDN70DRAFT_884268 [Pholiota conissans]